MVKSKPAKSLGKSIIKDRFKKQNQRHDGESFLHTTEMNDGYDWGRLNLQSVTEESNLKDFLSTAELAGTEFTAERLNIKFIDSNTNTGLLSQEEEVKTQEAQKEHKQWLRIPRRPDWDSTTSATDLDKNEKESFLEWRRKLAQLQEVENIMLTPYEKNLDFWRQLWRVIERSDIIVQIVDARNPLLFRCEDLETYVKEVSADKMNILLVNKADYLTREQRKSWYDYFKAVCADRIRVVFWSATDEVKRQEREEALLKSVPEGEPLCELDTEYLDSEMTLSSEQSNTDNIGENETEHRVNDVMIKTDENMSADRQETTNEMESACSISSSFSSLLTSHPDTNETSAANKPDNFDPTDILIGPQLIELFKSVYKGNTYQMGLTTVGMVGYPNVGKSSTINAILKMKKVPVSATPGRTKHFQTLYVDSELMLCDCPGLVFPSFVSTKAELILNGVLPIDQMRDHVPPVSLLCKHIPRSTLEHLYGINIVRPGEGEDPDRSPRADELLRAYAYMRGFMTSKGVPDCSRASRIILKDYVTGRLLYANPPVGVVPEDFQAASALAEPVTVNVEKMLSVMPSKMDEEFFSNVRPKVHSKGVHGTSDFTRSEVLRQFSRSGETTPVGSQLSVCEKPWRKHNNRKKKEKTRRLYSHLDKH